MNLVTIEGKVESRVPEAMQHDAARELSDLLVRWAKKYHNGLEPYGRSVEIRS